MEHGLWRTLDSKICFLGTTHITHIRSIHICNSVTGNIRRSIVDKVCSISTVVCA